MSRFVLADCNNFYVSCERLFNPRLEGQPVIALSNNDGCVVARSQEAKKLGIKMGEPFFKIRDFCSRMKVAVFSSNYQLYGDLSDRVIALLSHIAPEVEVYSIDEVFLKYPDSDSPEALFQHCLEMRKKVRKWIGIPISLGIGPTKTLAKVANDYAKKSSYIFDLSDPGIREKTLKEVLVEEVWGIGRQLKVRLNQMGVFTAWEFQSQDPCWIRKKMGVIGERMLLELQGVSCLSLEETPPPKKSITCSRSFGKIVTDPQELAEALATYTHTACVKLRDQQSLASALCVFLEATLDAKAGTRSTSCLTTSFSMPTCDTSRFITAAKNCLNKLYNKKERYKKCGVILLDLIPERRVIPDFFQEENPKKRLLMSTLDSINAQHGKHTLFFGAMGVNQRWKGRSDSSSRPYTTDWSNLAIVKA